MKMTETIRVRVTKEMKSHLESLAEKRGPGSKVADLVREAIHQVYFKTYPIEEITAHRAVQKPKKSNGG
jgi:predicted DNA-binding protein